MAPPRELAIDVTCTETADERPAWEEPVSPVGRLFLDPRLSTYLVCVFGLAAPVDLATLRRGLQATLVRHPRFCSVQVMNKAGSAKWVHTTVNLDDHLIVPDLNPAAKSADTDRAMEDYLSSLSTLPMDHSRPLWEVHVLAFPTTDAAAALAFRLHHSLGDGVSLLSLLVACARPAADPTTAATRRTGQVRAMPPLPRPRVSAVMAWFMYILVLAWNTVVDVVRFVATTSSILRDPQTLLKGTEGVEFRPKRFVNRTLSLDDVKHVKNVMNCTVNDVLLGVTSAALSLYYFRKNADQSGKKNINVRSTLAVNLRKTPGLHTLASMMESGEDNAVKWGNQLGYMIFPFHISKHEDLLEYVREAIKMARRKKISMESVFTYKSTTMLLKIFGVKATASLCYKLFRNTTLVYSNVIGPSELVVLFGHPIVYIAPSGYGLPTALGIIYQSYMNIIKVVLSVDEARFPDAHDLLDDIAESLKLIREAA